ncbi:hypothetical protein ACWCQL_27065 [Streptomyces sp. NPDC002073]
MTNTVQDKQRERYERRRALCQAVLDWSAVVPVLVKVVEWVVQSV